MNTDPRVKEVNTLFTHYHSRIKSKKFLLEKIKDYPNTVRFYAGFENYDAVIAVCKCFEPKASTMHF